MRIRPPRPRRHPATPSRPCSCSIRHFLLQDERVPTAIVDNSICEEMWALSTTRVKVSCRHPSERQYSTRLIQGPNLISPENTFRGFGSCTKILPQAIIMGGVTNWKIGHKQYTIARSQKSVFGIGSSRAHSRAKQRK